MMLEPFEIPEEGTRWCPRTGFAMNLPVVVQGYPFWWEDHPEIVALLNLSRQEAEIVIDDFPDGPPVRPESTAVVMRPKEKEVGFDE